MKVLISGGGIAGITMAIALQKKGFETEIFESAPVIGPVGAGLALGANAVKVIKLLGMYEELPRLASRMKTGLILDQHGKLITSTGEQQLGNGLTTATFAIHRADLHTLLLKHYEGRIHTGDRAVAYEEKDGKIILTLRDGTKTEGDFLVAADGIHSLLRKQVLPESRLRFTGFGCWRGVIPQLPEGIDPQQFSETWGIKGRFGIVPIGGNRVYWFATAPAETDNEMMRAMTVSDLRGHFSGYHEDVQKVLAAAEGEPLIYSDLIDLEPITNFAFGRMALAGDAAHATTPNLGQGACQAMEDALVFANCLSENPTAEGIKRYSELRLPRTTKVVNTSWKMGKIAENGSPLMSSLRNGMLRMLPRKMSEKQVRFLYDVRFPGWE